MIKVSIIVAVFQVEKYIVRCLESIRNQTLPDFEVLLIDDGSFDSSGSICDEYSRKDKRFKVFHKKNEGVSSARQMGLEQAIGEYIIHVDPDDWMDLDMLEELYKAAKKNNADLVICDFFREFETKTLIERQNPNLSTNDGYFKGLIENLHGGCWNKLVRRSCFSKYNITFSKDVIMWEDRFVNLKLAENAIKVYYLPKAFYHYFVNGEGAVANMSRKKVYSVVHVINWLENKDFSCKENDIIILKKWAKQYAFLAKDVNTIEFKNLFSEINNKISFRFSEIGRSESFYVFFALKISLKLSRFLYFNKKKLSKKVRLLWQK